MPASFTDASHFIVSERSQALAVEGVLSALIESSLKRRWTFGMRMTLLMASFSSVKIWAGIPAGAKDHVPGIGLVSVQACFLEGRYIR
jgi:hypothetical protein